MNNAWFTPVYIGLDVETGGIGLDKSLLTVYCSILNSSFDELKSLYLELKPNNSEPYVVSAEALAVNGIDLVKHDKTAISLSEGGRQLRELLRDYTEQGKIKLTPIGHGVVFDIQFLQHHLLNKNEMNKYVSYRVVDTSNIAKFLQIQGKISNEVSGSLSSLVQYFNLDSKLEGRAHTADYDVKATILILQEMMKL